MGGAISGGRRVFVWQVSRVKEQNGRGAALLWRCPSAYPAGQNLVPARTAFLVAEGHSFVAVLDLAGNNRVLALEH